MIINLKQRKMRIYGTILNIFEIQTFNNDFKKQNLIIVSGETGTPYKVEFHSAKLELLKGVKVNSIAMVDFNIKGNYFPHKIDNKPTGLKDVANSFVGYALTLV